MILELLGEAVTAQQDSESVTTRILLAALASTGIGAILGAIVNAVATKRRNSADATELITRAATGTVAMVESQLERLRKEAREDREDRSRESREMHEELEDLKRDHAAEIRARDEAHAHEVEEWRRTLQVHAAWDFMALKELAKHDILLPKAPPLLPPTGTSGKVEAGPDGEED